MQLGDLIKPLDQQTDEELIERLRQIRHQRSVVRPAAARHKKKADTKKSRGTIKKVEDMFESMTPEMRAELIKQLGG